MKIEKNKLFKRQTILDDFGVEKQQKLQEAHVAIIGCGGLGSVAATYLAGSGIGHIHLIDYDQVDLSNLHRQVFYKVKDVGKQKTKILARHISSINPFVKVSTSNQAIEKNNIKNQIKDFDIVLDCTDSLPVKYLLNDYCVLNNIVLVYGSLYKHDGYVASFNIPERKSNSANLRDAFPQIPKEYIPNCSEIGTLNPIVGIIGLMQANEVIKIISGIGAPLKNQILIYNTLENTQYKMKLSPSKKNNKSAIKEIFDSENYEEINCELQEEKYIIPISEFKNKLSKKHIEVISVMENTNNNLPFNINKTFPFSTFNVDEIKIDANKEYIIICKKGITSYTATILLKEKYPSAIIYSLQNGIDNF